MEALSNLQVSLTQSVVRPYKASIFILLICKKNYNVHIATCFNLVSFISVIMETSGETPVRKGIFIEIKGVLLSNA